MRTKIEHRRGECNPLVREIVLRRAGTGLLRYFSRRRELAGGPRV
jgi:hypothetical protein